MSVSISILISILSKRNQCGDKRYFFLWRVLAATRSLLSLNDRLGRDSYAAAPAVEGGGKAPFS